MRFLTAAVFLLAFSLPDEEKQLPETGVEFTI
jgi:hypothetical protein